MESEAEETGYEKKREAPELEMATSELRFKLDAEVEF
jgi:hypothetical protein